MDVWRITVAALRRWYVLLPLLALTVLATLWAGRGADPEYDALATGMVVPGSTVSVVPNPYGNVEDANTALGIVLGSPETRARVAAQGLDPSYEVTALNRSTIFNITTRGADAEVEVKTADAVLDAARRELATRQTSAGVPDKARYGLTVLQQPSVSPPSAEGSMRVMAAVGVLGAAGSLVVAVLFDDILGLLRRWRERRRDARSTTGSETSSPGRARHGHGRNRSNAALHPEAESLVVDPGAVDSAVNAPSNRSDQSSTPANTPPRLHAGSQT